ncbi:MAG: methyltransferase family protein [Phycisphaerales bacterium]
MASAARAFALSYLAIQTAALVAYWLVLWLIPGSRPLFAFRAAPDQTLLAIAAPDLLVFGVIGAAAGWAVWRQAGWAFFALTAHAGAAAYAAVLAIGMWIAEPRLWPGAGLMLPALFLPGVFAWHARPGARAAGEPTAASSLLKTAAQTVVFWAFFLFVVPPLIVRIEMGLGWSRWPIDPRVSRYAAVFLFAIAGACGVWSGWTMAVVGRGTPLPTDPACRLVVVGPYRFIRNPMAFTGVLQAVAVGIWLGAWSVVLYAVCGAVLWHMLVRPVEERELADRFGAAYRRYVAAVRCWLPRMKPYPG